MKRAQRREYSAITPFSTERLSLGKPDNYAHRNDKRIMTIKVSDQINFSLKSCKKNNLVYLTQFIAICQDLF